MIHIEVSMNQGEILTDASWKCHVQKSYQYIRETEEHMNQRLPQELVIVGEKVSDFVPTKRAGVMILQPGTNTISMKPVVASRKRPYSFPLRLIRHLAQTHCTTISFRFSKLSPIILMSMTMTITVIQFMQPLDYNYYCMFLKGGWENSNGCEEDEDGDHVAAS